MGDEINKQSANFDRIERYLLNEMSGAEKVGFEAELRSSAELRKETEELRTLVLAAQAGAFRQRLDEASEAFHGKAHPKQLGVAWWMGIAASIMLVVAFSWWYTTRTASNDLFAQHAQPDPGLPTPMSHNARYDFYDAMVDYKAQKYELALSKWQTLKNSDMAQDTLYFYLGSAHFALGQYEQAQDYFFTIMRMPYTNYREKSAWYAALSAYRLNRKTQIDSLVPFMEQGKQDIAKEFSGQLDGR